MESNHLFVVGCARTGSTLLRHLLNRNERICLLPETHYLRRISRVGLRKQILRFGDLSDDRNADRFVDYLYSPKKAAEKNYWGWLNRNIDKRHFRERLLASDRSERAIFALMIELYAQKKKGEIGPDLILGEKTPTHIYYVPTLLEWFPDARIIHTFRDPRGIFVSTLKREQQGRWGLKAKFTSVPETLLNPLVDPLAILHVTKTWFDAVHLHFKYERMYPGRYHLVRFEDVIAEPERQLERICEFLGIPFEREILDEVVVVSSSYLEQRRGPTGFDKQSINRWREHISPFAEAWFTILGGKYLKRFGYTP